MENNLEQYLDRLESPGQVKVYCRDCRWLGQVRRRSSGVFFYRRPPFVSALGQCLRCLHPNARQLTATWWGEEATQLHPAKRNAHNDCPDFHPMTEWQRWGDVALLGGGLLGVLVLVAAAF